MNLNFWLHKALEMEPWKSSERGRQSEGASPPSQPVAPALPEEGLQHLHEELVHVHLAVAVHRGPELAHNVICLAQGRKDEQQLLEDAGSVVRPTK